MKAIFQWKASVLFLALSFTTLAAFAAHDKDIDAEKNKKYSKSYPLSSSDKVVLDNSFGEMKINTWTKNEVKVDVDITVRANSESYAQDLIDRITILDSKEGGVVKFKTKIGDEKGKSGKNQKTDMKINYTVYLPASQTLDATNQFGPMSIGDYSGTADLTSKFGSLTTGKLSNAREINVEFGKAEIESVSNSKVVIKFSEANINRISGSMDTRFEFCKSSVKLGIDNSLNELNVYNSYSTLNLDVSKDLSASFKVTTHFGDLNDRASLGIKEEKADNEGKYGPKFDKRYSGSVGGGKAKITVDSHFGKVNII